jgi:hypothetical protein
VNDADEQPGCGPCEAEALLRVIAVRELLEFVVWGQSNPLSGVTAAIRGLQNARNMLLASGYEVEP